MQSWIAVVLGALMAILLTWEVVAALRRGWSRLKVSDEPVFRSRQPVGYWTNIVVHAAVALVGAWAAIVIGREL